MSHNPNTVKSQHELTNDELGRTMTLLKAIEQLEKTECELERVETEKKRYSEQLHEATKQIERLQKQLDIAVKALEKIKNMKSSGKKSIVAEIALDDINSINMAEKLIKAGVPKVIKELDN